MRAKGCVVQIRSGRSRGSTRCRQRGDEVGLGQGGERLGALPKGMEIPTGWPAAAADRMAAMAYQVLARKWRPRSFETLVGQEHVVRALTHALATGRLQHAYLFTGTRR